MLGICQVARRLGWRGERVCLDISEFPRTLMLRHLPGKSGISHRLEMCFASRVFTTVSLLWYWDFYVRVRQLTWAKAGSSDYTSCVSVRHKTWIGNTLTWKTFQISEKFQRANNEEVFPDSVIEMNIARCHGRTFSSADMTYSSSLHVERRRRWNFFSNDQRV